MIQLPSLSAHFNVTVKSGRGYEWAAFQLRDEAGSFEEAAFTLAWHIMVLRCAGAPQHFTSWLEALAGGTLDNRSTAALAAFVTPGFGVPDAVKSLDHLQAVVAGHLWFVLHIETARSRGIEIRHAESPKLHVTAPGGDGLVVQDGGSGLGFRLWELKKHTGRSPISKTVRKAYGQLRNSGVEYLAEYTALSVGMTEMDLKTSTAGWWTSG